MAIKPKMLGHGISSGTLRVASNEGAPMYYGRRTCNVGKIDGVDINYARGYQTNSYPEELLHDYMWTDDTHLYEFTTVPMSIRVYDISYNNDESINLTFNREMYINAPEHIYCNTNTSFMQIGYIGRLNKLYNFSQQANKLYVTEFTVEENTVSVSVKQIAMAGFATCLIITSEDSDLIKIISAASQYGSQNGTSTPSFAVCKLSEIMSSDVAFSTPSAGTYVQGRCLSIFNKNQIFYSDTGVGYTGTLFTFNPNTLTYDATIINNSNKSDYQKYGNIPYRQGFSDCKGIIYEYDDYMVVSLMFGTLLMDNCRINKVIISGKSSNSNESVINCMAISQWVDIPLPYVKDCPVRYDRIRMYNSSASEESSACYLEESNAALLCSSDLTVSELSHSSMIATPALIKNVTPGTFNGYIFNIYNSRGIINTKNIYNHIFLCLGKLGQRFTSEVSVSSNSCGELKYQHINSDTDNKQRFSDTQMLMSYPKGFYAANTLICHNNNIYGVSRIDYNSFSSNNYANNISNLIYRSPYKSLMVSTMKYNPDTDTFSQSFAGMKPIVSKSDNIQEIVSITVSKVVLDKNKYFDSISFDYGNSCKIVMRKSETEEVITLYEGEIKEVFDFSTHPIVLNPGYELFVLTTYEAWECTAFGVEIET